MTEIGTPEKEIESTPMVEPVPEIIEIPEPAREPSKQPEREPVPVGVTQTSTHDNEPGCPWGGV